MICFYNIKVCKTCSENICPPILQPSRFPRGRHGYVLLLRLPGAVCAQARVYSHPAFSLPRCLHTLHVSLPFALFYLTVYLDSLSMLLYMILLFLDMVCIELLYMNV